MGSERNRSISPLCRSAARPIAVPDGAEHRPSARRCPASGSRRRGRRGARVDRAAEDVAEHQHEDHRLDRREHQQLRGTRRAIRLRCGDGAASRNAERPAADRRGRTAVAVRSRAHLERRARSGRPRAPPRLVGAGSARRPVSDRNTSSRLGSRTARPPGASLAASSARSTSHQRRAARRRREPDQRALALGPLGRAAGQDASRPASRARSLGNPTSMTVVPSSGLERGGRVVGDHVAVVDDRDALGQPVGLLQVLRGEQHRRALATSSRISSHSALRLCGSSPVVGSSRNSTGGVTRARRRRPAAGACRPSRCGRGGRPRRPGRSAPAARRRAG